MKTFSAKPLETERTWWVIDAEGQTLGRLASLVANLLRGKHKPIFTPHIDTGDFVIVVNADKIVVTGKKATQKKYYDHSLYPGGMRTTVYRDMKSDRVIERAVWGMLPHTSLGRQQKLKLKVYTGPDHPHAAQQPKPYQVVKKSTPEVA
jgi:large subunit ribosomal protein L13